MTTSTTTPSPHTLYCLPYAGGSAHAFSAIRPHLPSSLRIIALDYPGHGSRATEPLLSSADAIAQDLLASSCFEPTASFTLLGHSMGAHIAWLMARILCRSGQPPRHLILSARQAPCVPRLHPDLHHRNDADFIQEMERYGGLQKEIIADPSARAFFLPILRADFAAVETWRPSAPPKPLPVPISAISGETDPVAPPEGINAWSAYSSTGFDQTLFEGGHFFLFENPVPVCAHIAHLLNAAPKR